jgi:hypothetical protein
MHKNALRRLFSITSKKRETTVRSRASSKRHIEVAELRNEKGEQQRFILKRRATLLKELSEAHNPTIYFTKKERSFKALFTEDELAGLRP